MKKNKNKIKTDLACEAVHGQPHDAFDMVNKYGTYEIQPTADSENRFPEIAQGTAQDGKNKKKTGGK